jgi:hypothetical protein
MAKSPIHFALTCWLSLSLSLLLPSSCLSRKINMTVKPVERTPVDLPAIPPLQLDPMHWQIVTESNFPEQMQKIKDSGMQPVFFTLDEKGYEALSVNMTKIRGYISQQKSVIYALKSYYNVPDNPESLTPPASIIAQMQQSQSPTGGTLAPQKPVVTPAPNPAVTPAAKPAPPAAESKPAPTATNSSSAKKRLIKLIPPYIRK